LSDFYYIYFLGGTRQVLWGKSFVAIFQLGTVSGGVRVSVRTEKGVECGEKKDQRIFVVKFRETLRSSL
jgi:hypothetical protein